MTVDRKDGEIRGQKNTLVTDLPGIYSMSPYSSEEIVTRNFVLNEHPRGIINIVDATNIERNLYLTMQLMELDVPMVLALNMMDEVRENRRFCAREPDGRETWHPGYPDFRCKKARESMNWLPMLSMWPNTRKNRAERTL